MVDIAKLGLSVDSSGFVKADRDMKGFNQTAGRSEKAADRMNKSARALGQGLGLLAAASAAVAAAGVKMAIDAEETANKFRVVFRGSIVETDKALRELTKTIPSTQSELRGFAAGVQDLLVPLGLARTEAAGLSVDAVRLAGDLASFNNVGVDEVLNGIKSALAGSSEPLRRFGIDVREGRLQTLALSEGLIGLDQELNGAARAQAVFAAISADSSDAAGDAAETVDSLANAVRFLQRDVKQVTEELGTALLPAIRDVLTVLTDTEDGMSMVESAARKLFSVIIILAQGFNALALVFTVIGKEIGEIAAKLNLMSEALKIDFELSDLVKPLSAYRKILGTLDVMPERLDDVARGFVAINEAADEDISQSYQNFGDLLDALSQSFSDLNSGVTRDLEEVAGGLDDVVEAIGPTEAELAALAKAAQEAADALSAFRDSNADLAAELAGPSAVAAKKFNEQAALAKGFLDDGAISAKEYAESIRLYRTELVRSLTPIEDVNQEYELTQEIFADTINSLQDEINMRGLSGDALIAYQRELFIINQLSRQGSELTAEQAEQIRALAGDAFDAAGELKGLAGALQDFFDTVLSEDLSRALSESIQQGIQKGISNINAQDVLSGDFDKIGKQLGQTLMTEAGRGIGLALSGGNPLVGEIGALLGDIIGQELFSGGVAKFQIRGSDATRATDVGTDTTLNTALGELNFAFRDIEAAAQKQIERAFINFDTTIASFIRDEDQLAQIDAALREFGVSSRSDGEDIEGLLQLRFDAIVSTFDDFTQSLVQAGGTLEEQVQRLNDIIQITTQVGLRRGLGLTASDNQGQIIGPIGAGNPGLPGPGLPDPGFSEQPNSMAAAIARMSGQINETAQDIGAFNSVLDGTGSAADVASPSLRATLELVAELNIPLETLAETFERLRTVAGLMDAAIGLTGATFGETRQDVIRFGVELADAFGGVDKLGAAFNRIFGAFFTETQRLEVGVQQSTERAIQLLADLGIEATDALLSQAGFGDLFQSLFGTLDPAATALLIEAGVEIARLIDLEADLAIARGDGGDSAQALIDAENELNSIMANTLAILSPFRAEWAELSQSLAETELRAKALGATEQQLIAIRAAAEVQQRAFVASLTESITSLVSNLFGAGTQAAQSFANTANSVAGAANNFRDQWLSVIDSISDALDNQLLGTSTLTAEERQAESVNQFNAALAAAQGGDLGAAQSLAGLFNQAIREGASFFGSTTTDFADLEAQLRSALENADLPIPPESPDVQTAINTANTAASTASIEMSAFEQLQQASQLLDQIGLLAEITGRAPSDIGAEFGIPIADLINILTGTVPDLTGDALAGYFDNLVEETSAQLNELAQLEITANDQLFELRTISDLLRGIEMQGFAGPAPTPPGFANGGWVNGPGTIMAGEHGRELVLPNQVSEFFARSGIPVNSATSSAAVEAKLDAVIDALINGNSISLQQLSETQQTGNKLSDKLGQINIEQKKSGVKGKPTLSRA